jgi:hypothetical protein
MDLREDRVGNALWILLGVLDVAAVIFVVWLSTMLGLFAA